MAENASSKSGSHVARTLSSLWSSGGLIWTIASACFFSLVWVLTTRSTLTTSIQLLQSEKVDAKQVLAIIDREMEKDDIKGSFAAILSRLRQIEIELSRLSTLVEEQQGAAPGLCLDTAVSDASFAP